MYPTCTDFIGKYTRLALKGVLTDLWHSLWHGQVPNYSMCYIQYYRNVLTQLHQLQHHA